MLMNDRPQKDSRTGRFLPGNSGYGGRPKGARNKLGEAFITALAEDFEAHGAEAIAVCRSKHPHRYLGVVAQLLPKEIDLAIEADIRQEIKVAQFVGDYRTLKAAIERLGVNQPQLLEAKEDD